MKNSPNKNQDVAQSIYLKTGELERMLPVFSALKNYREINPWHDHQSVFDHTAAVLASFETYLRAARASEKAQDRILLKYLSEPVYGAPRERLIRTAIVFHDISKPDVWQENAKTGQTACPGHEFRSSQYVQHFGADFGLSRGAARVVSELVLLHGDAHEATNAALAADGSSVYRTFEKTVGDFYTPLLLLSRADGEGSDLPVLDAAHWAARRQAIDGAVAAFCAGRLS